MSCAVRSEKWQSNAFKSGCHALKPGDSTCNMLVFQCQMLFTHVLLEFVYYRSLKLLVSPACLQREVLYIVKLLKVFLQATAQFPQEVDISIDFIVYHIRSLLNYFFVGAKSLSPNNRNFHQRALSKYSNRSDVLKMFR
eukprot:3181252-Amphidinium_carterae.1